MFVFFQYVLSVQGTKLFLLNYCRGRPFDSWGGGYGFFIKKNIFKQILETNGLFSYFVPKPYKKGLVNCLVFRAWKLCSSYVLFHSEILFVKELLMSNGYPANFIDSIVLRFLSKQFSNTNVMQPYGPHKRRVYLCLPYVGELATNKFARQIRRLIAKIAPCVELRLVFRAAQKLSCLTRLKSKLNVLSRSGVVYQISCSQCEAFYVGKTKRRLEQRVQEHSQ